jgi:O-antigen/teichoic acid export membrane protein
MQNSYSKNYLQIYFFQILSIVLGFASLFVVVPFLSEDKTTFGIYSVCISITIFLSYADLGFLGAGMKYAAESFSKNDREEEIKIVGFTHFVLLVFLLLISGVFLYLSFNPHLLIKDIVSESDKNTASSLLLILAVFSPTIIFQRVLQMIYGVRLKQFIFQKINIVGNLFKIISVFYFFGNGKYDIVNYYLFVQSVTLICSLVGVIKAKQIFDYDFLLLFKSFRPSKLIFDKTKSLAFSTLFVTISWILYYELDQFVIGKFLGAEEVAIFAIGLTVLGFFRSLLGVFYAPFSARFNHFIGKGQEKELKKFYNHILIIALPVVVFPILGIVFFAESIVISWVGIEYQESIVNVQWLVACNILGFINYPTGMLLVAQKRIKEMYIISFLMPVVYWVGIYSTINFLGVESFGIFKFTIFFANGLVYLWFSIRFLQVSLFSFVKNNLSPYLPATIILITSLVFTNDFFIEGKDKINLLLNALIMGGNVLVAFAVCLVFVKPIREYAVKMFHVIRPAKNEV